MRRPEPPEAASSRLAYEGMMADPDQLREQPMGLPLGRRLMSSICLRQATRAEDPESSPWGDGPDQHNTFINTTSTPISPAAPLVSPDEHPAHGDG